jgi:hypothetical protein
MELGIMIPIDHGMQLQCFSVCLAAEAKCPNAKLESMERCLGRC